MLRASLLCSSISPSDTPFSLFNSQIFPPFSIFRRCHSVAIPSRSRFRFNLIRNGRNSSFHVRSTAFSEVVETSNSEFELVEVGYLYGVHGLQGEICIKPSTDFPELRFSKPGKRWLRRQVLGQEKIEEVELMEGRSHPGQKSWILKFRGLDSIDQVQQLVGSTLLAKEDDRPELDQGEFYTRDLVGMRVLLKETGQVVGTVSKVYDNAGYDLLHVMLDSSVDSKSSEGSGTGRLVWIPFVKAIVPDVNLQRREMHITPPKGLLELNMRTDNRSKKERRQLQWKERKKHQKRLIAAKKKLCELDQQHVFDGLKFGEKSQRNLLAESIIAMNFNLFQQALQSIKTSTKRWDTTEQINALRAKLPEGTLNVSRECLNPDASQDKMGEIFSLLQQGQSLISEGKVSFCLVLDNGEFDITDPASYLYELLRDEQKFIKEEDRARVPLILVCPEHAIQTLQKLFQDNDDFGFESEKIWFLREETLPVVCSSSEETKKHKILMKSPWEILESPVGSGGVISLIDSHDITDTLSNLGIDYLQVCSVNGNAREASRYINPILTGFVNIKAAELGIQIREDSEIFEMTLSTKFLKRLKGKLGFEGVVKMNRYVQKMEKEWIESIPTEPNSIEFRSSIFTVLDQCSLSDKICLIDITQ